MANPFSAVATIHRVQAGCRWGYANCAWAASGICALDLDGRIDQLLSGLRTADRVRDPHQAPSDETLLFDSLVSGALVGGRRLHLKRDESLAVGGAHSPAGSAPRKACATISAGKLSELAYAWWGDRLAPDRQPEAREHNQAILDQLGLTGSGDRRETLARLLTAVRRAPGPRACYRASARFERRR